MACKTSWNKGKDVSFSDEFNLESDKSDIITQDLLKSILIELRIANQYSLAALNTEITEEDLDNGGD